MTNPKLTRRAALTAGAALPLAAAVPSASFAKAEMKGVSTPIHNRITLGSFEVTTLLAASRAVEGPHSIFGMNVSDEEFAAASDAALIPNDSVQFFFTPTLVNTGSELILFDTGLNAEGITTAIEAAGYSADQVDKVVITLSLIHI